MKGLWSGSSGRAKKLSTGDALQPESRRPPSLLGTPFGDADGITRFEDSVGIPESFLRAYGMGWRPVPHGMRSSKADEAPSRPR